MKLVLKLKSKEERGLHFMLNKFFKANDYDEQQIKIARSRIRALLAKDKLEHILLKKR